MFKSIKRLLIAATAVVAVSGPSAAYAMVQVAPGGPATSSHAQPTVAPRLPVAQLRRLDAGAQQRFVSEAGWPTRASAINSTGPSSQAGFQWGDAGIGVAGVLALVGFSAGMTLVIRRRVHQPLAS
jgi:hypothetical protein